MDKKINLSISEDEMRLACQAGCMRRLNAIKANTKDQAFWKKDQDKWEIDIEGAAAELAVAKWLDRAWFGMASDQYKSIKGDVSGFQIRHTKLLDGCLIIRDRDQNNAFFILVVGTYPQYQVAGWLKAKDAKRDIFLRKGIEHAWFVPQTHLLDPIELEMSLKLQQENNEGRFI